VEEEDVRLENLGDDLEPDDHSVEGKKGKRMVD
jgi:hypothetical protein